MITCPKQAIRNMEFNFVVLKLICSSEEASKVFDEAHLSFEKLRQFLESNYCLTDCKVPIDNEDN